MEKEAKNEEAKTEEKEAAAEPVEEELEAVLNLANEYKRRQSPPGVKITPKAFGRDRRMPITNRYVPK